MKNFKILMTPEAEKLYNSWRVLGRKTNRSEAYEKVIGKAQYTDDIMLPDMLYGAYLKSPYAHAKIRTIDTSKAEVLPGVVAVATYKTIARLGLEKSLSTGVVSGETILYNRVYFVGDAVAAVAAEDPAIAEEACELIEVEYEELPFYLTPEESMAEGAVLIHPEASPKGNYGLFEQVIGDPQKGLAEADVVIETEYREPTIRHMFLEGHTSIARWDGENLHAWMSTQTPVTVISDLERGFGIPRTRIFYTQPYVGGGFGGKFSPGRSLAVAALLAKSTRGRPVKIRTNINEQFVIEHRLTCGPSTMQIKLGAKQDGTITAIDQTVYAGNGAFSFSGQSGHNLEQQLHNFYSQNNGWHGYGVCNNNQKSGALRAYGSQTAVFANDGALSELAEKLGMDLVDLEKKIGGRKGICVHRAGDVLAGGDIPNLIDKAATEYGWKSKWKGWGRPTSVNGSKRRALGTGLATHCCCNPGSSATDWCMVNMSANNHVSMSFCMHDVGSGVETSCVQCVAEVLGMDFEDIRHAPPTTSGQPYSLGTYASRGLAKPVTAAYRAAEDARRNLLARAAEILKAKPEDLDTKNKTVYVKSDPKKFTPYAAVLRTYGNIMGLGFGNPYNGLLAAYPPGIGVERSEFFAIAEVEVDTDTGKVEVINLQMAAQGGMIVNPIIMYGQILGGLVHGTSQMLGEGYIYDERTGTPLNASIVYYPQLTAADVKEDVYSMLCVSDPAHAPTIPFHAKGLAEGIYCAAWPAINAAIYNAIKGAGGKRIKEFPFTPERILTALGKANFPKTKGVA
jgi:xanthine dehydrogenase molybdenum-binding subunit